MFYNWNISSCMSCVQKKKRRKQAGIGANFETAQNIIFAKVVAVH